MERFPVQWIGFWAAKVSVRVDRETWIGAGEMHRRTKVEGAVVGTR
jgi:hypothetical protein